MNFIDTLSVIQEATLMRKSLPILFALVLVGCGKSPVSEPTPPPITDPRHAVQLLVFGAGYCDVCKAKFPQIESLLAQLPAAARKNVNVQIYVTSGDPASVPPDQTLADYYKSKYFASANGTQPDGWRWKTFKKYGLGRDVPAAVVLDAGGNVLQKYIAGDTTFMPEAIAGFIKSQVMGR